MVLIDSDFFIGLLHKGDIHNKKCTNIYLTLKHTLITSWDVIDEVATKLNYFGKRHLVIEFILMINKVNIQIIYPNNDLFRKTQIIFNSQKKTHVSFTDCMNMAIAKDKDISYILSFDRIYERNGFKLFT